MQLHRDKHKLDAAGVELVIIGNGAPNFIEGFREQTKYDGPIYTDPSLATFKAAELLRDRVTITRLASGLPVGADLEHADEVTLGRALAGRRSLEGAA